MTVLETEGMTESEMGPRQAVAGAPERPEPGPANAPGRDPALDPGISDPILEIDKLSLWYGAKQALKDISLDIPQKKITAFIGPSGCGKSTLLRCINRLNELTEGGPVDGQVRSQGAR